MELTRIFIVLGLLAALAGCSGSGGAAKDDGTTGGAYDGGASSSGAGDGGLAAGGAFGGDGTADQGALSPLDNRVIYFAFDTSEVDSESAALLAEHGEYLVEHPAVSVRLEGHADERGSREYNIGLGERRAQAVRQILLLQGVAATQLSTVSYGEERPAALGSDEEAWSLNRRVELVYSN